MIKGDLCGLRVRGGLICDHSAAVVIFLKLNGIGATDDDAQSASFRDTA